MNPIPLRTDLTDTEQQDLYSVLRGLEEKFSGAEIEAYCEKEIGTNNTKWDAYVIKYNKARSDNPK